MLSTENPPDPSCSCKVSGLKNDDRPSDKLALLKTGLDDDNHQLPTFSIRDYVFTARQRNIGTNWPFPQQYLQLCSRYGIKDLLPPFEPPDAVRNRFCGSNQLVFLAERREKSSVAVGLHDGVNESVHGDRTDHNSCKKSEQSIVRSLDQAPSQSSSPEESEKLTFPDHVREGEVPSTVICHEECEQDLVPTNTLPCPVQETPTTLSELDVLEPPRAPQKNETAVETSGKKYRLIVKLGSLSDPSRAEHINSNTTTISDPMASKVCPVCKTFSSTSNTTLNAHIDQCLSVESTSQWAIDAAKLTKHRIKPRKMRSMADIYVTAPRCTLEDLDRRNGSNWATDSSLLNTEAKVAAEGKRKRLSRVGLQDTADEGAVYFDSNGTKVRILSKFCDTSVSTQGEDSKLRKQVKDGTQSKSISTDKKTRIGPKHSNYLKPKIQNKRSCHPSQDEAGTRGAPDTKRRMDKKLEKEESLSQLLKTRGQTSHCESGTLRQWVCSKRTGLLKKLNGKYSPQGLRYPFPMTSDLEVKNNQPDLNNSLVEGSHMLKSQNPPENDTSSPNSKYTMEYVSSGCQMNGSVEKSSKLHESHLNQSVNGGSLSTDGACALELSRSSGKFSSYPRSKRIEVHADQIKSSDSLPRMALKPSHACQLFSIRGRKSSTFRNGLLARQSFPNPKCGKSRKRSTLKKSQMHRSIAKMAEKVKALPSQLDEQHNQRQHDSSGNLSGCSNQIQMSYRFDTSEARTFETEAVMNELSVDGKGVHKSKKEGEDLSISGREEPMVLNSSFSGSEVCGLDLVSTVDSQVRGSCPQFQCSDIGTYKEDGPETGAEVLLHMDDVVRTFSKEDVGGTFDRSSGSLGLEMQKTIICPDIHSNSLQSTGEHKRLVFGNEPPMPLLECLSENQVTCANDVGTGIFQNKSVGLKSNCGVGERNCSSEVQFAGCGSISTHIPESSGTLLLGPGDLGSPEHIQDDLSLASNKILSSQEQQVVDRETSGSPISASSTISHPLIARSDSNFSAPESSVKPPKIQEKFVSGFSASSLEPVAGNASAFSYMNAAERMNSDTESRRGTRSSAEEESVKFKDVQACCCAQKESLSLDPALTYQDSQIPSQHIMSIMMQASKEKRATCTLNNRPERNDKVVVPIIESPEGPVIMKGPSSPIQKLPSHDGCCSAGPLSQVHQVQSTSNPILRLMGKNLMVINKNEDASVQIAQPAPSVQNDHTTYCNLLGFSRESTTSQDHSSLFHGVPEGFAIFGQEPRDPPSQCFGVNIPKGHSGQRNSEPGQRSQRPPPAGNCNTMDMGGFSRSSLVQRGISGGINLQAQEKLPISGPISSFTYDAERVISAGCHQNMNSVSAAQASGSLVREVIVIDDSPENEAESRVIYAEPSHRLRERQSSVMGNCHPTALYSNLRHMSAFSCHMTPNPFSPRELPGGSRSIFSMPCPGRGNVSPLKWGDNSELSAVPLGSPFMARAPLTSHLCPTVYYSPSMS